MEGGQMPGGAMAAEDGDAGRGMVEGSNAGGAVAGGGIESRRMEGGGTEGGGFSAGESATSLLLSRLRSLEVQIKALRENDKFRKIFDMSIVSAVRLHYLQSGLAVFVLASQQLRGQRID